MSGYAGLHTLGVMGHYVRAARGEHFTLLAVFGLDDDLLVTLDLAA